MPRHRVHEIMTREVEAVPPETSVPELAVRMRDLRLSCLVVCEGRRPVGVISERDLVRLFADGCAAEAPPRAADVMSHPPVTIPEDAGVDHAMRIVRERRIRRLVAITGEGLLAGLVTQTDLLHAHADEVEQQRAELEREVAARTRELAEANARLQTLALVDGMLEIGNRRAMEQALDRLQASAGRYDRSYGVALFDVDHFKKYNDHYGHLEADIALRRVVDALGSTVRNADALYRYGGEEILAVLPETDLDGALRAAERGRAAVEALGLEHAAAPDGIVSVSAGVAVLGEARSWRDVVERADRALYAAKQAGRNRVGGPGGA